MDRHQELRPLVQGYALALCGALAACRELQGVLAQLSQAAALLIGAEDQSEQQHAVTEAQSEQLEACRRSLAAAAAAAAGSGQQPSTLLRPLFYASAAFQDLAETLLTGQLAGAVDRCCQTHGCRCFAQVPANACAAHTRVFPFPAVPPPAVVAPDWLPRFSATQRHQLFDAWFDAAPASALLPALTRQDDEAGALVVPSSCRHLGNALALQTILASACMPSKVSHPPMCPTQPPGGGSAQQHGRPRRPRAGDGGVC